MKIIQKIKEAFSSNKLELEGLCVEIAELSITIKDSFDIIKSTQREVLTTLMEMKGDILSLKRSHSCRDCKRKSLKKNSYDEETNAR